MQKKIETPDKLLKKDGTLSQIGYATKLILEYNRENIKHTKLRIKEWDYYAILTEDYGLALTVSDLGIMALYSVLWIDFNKKEYKSVDDMRILSLLKTNLPKTSAEGDIHVHRKKISIDIELKKKPGNDEVLLREIKVKAPSFNSGEGLIADLTLEQDINADTMVIATPWPKKPTHFYYNQKINCMKAKGCVRIGDNEYFFGEEHQKKAYAVLDWGRGVWTYKNTWYWSSLSDEVDGVPFGWNLGYGFSDRSMASENMLFYDGKAHKLDEVRFVIPENDYLSEWQIISPDNRVNIKFEPILDRSANINLLIFKSVQHQVFGRFSGVVVLDGGKELKIDNLLGFAEKVYNRW
ncbi:MAG: DUF2804 domain-containing protein [Promethearchaeota archaeon]